MSVLTKTIAKLCDRPEGGSFAGVDLSARLDRLASESAEGLEWRRSLVDLLKVAGLDASYGARKKLALELGYDEEAIYREGSAEMNRWTHGALMSRLASGGAKVPGEIPATGK